MVHNLANVLDAASHLRDRDNIRFLVVGNGAERAMLLAELGRRGLPNVVMQGPQPREAMPRVWNVYDVVLVHLKGSQIFAEVIPSRIFEAMSMGKSSCSPQPSVG